MKAGRLANFVLAIVVLFHVATQAGTILVTSTSDSGPGTLRAALASAADGDTIDATGVSGRILLTHGVLVVSNSVTILGPGPDHLTVNGNAAATVLLFTGENTVAAMSGLTIANGYSSGYSATEGRGGGIWSEASALSLSNCAISGNFANVHGGGIYSLSALSVSNCIFSRNRAYFGDGGGIYCGQGTLTVMGSTISSNMAFSGGGIFNESSAGTTPALVISGSILSYNQAGGGGGGGIHSSNGTVSITDTIVNSNTGLFGYSGTAAGGGIWSDASALSLSNCVVTGNRASYYGGGIYQGQGTLMIAGSTISSNTAVDAYGAAGGGIWSDASALSLSNCVVNGNRSSYYGGGIFQGQATLAISGSTISSNTAFVGGGIFSGSSAGTASTIVIADSILSYNQSINGSGGGIFSYFGALRVTNCLFSFNSAGGGGGIYANGGALHVTNCLFSFNSAGYEGGGIWANGEALQIANSAFNSNSATHGGGILNATRSTSESAPFIVSSTLTHNKARSGGGIANATTLIVSNCTLSYNAAPNDEFGGGGGVYNTADMQIIDSTLSGNQTGREGGGIFNAGGSLLIFNSMLSSNGANIGGGIYNLSTAYNSAAFVQMANSTLSGNQASAQGGAIFHSGHALHIYNSTLSGNWAHQGGGIYIVAPAQLGSTIFSAGLMGGSIEDDFHQALSLGYNLSSDDGGGVLTNSTDLINTDPMLGPLQDNGGPTWTHALQCGSPAIDQGTNFLGAPYDQRGFPFNRTFSDLFMPKPPGGDGTDIGAFEVQTTCLTPAQAVRRLIELVNSQWSPAKPLRATLSTAVASIERGKPTVAINQINAFQNQVTDQVMPSNPALGGTLLELAQVVINMLSGGQP